MERVCNNNETELLQRLEKNDEAALSSLMVTYYDNLYNYASRFTKDGALVKDCIQEVFISLWQRRQTAGSILSPKYYFLRAVKNKVLKAIHKSIRKATSTGLNDGYDFFHEFSIEHIIIEKQVSEEKAVKIKNIISQLSKRQKEIVYLKYYQYLDHTQIADLMNLNTQSVYNLLHEAIQKLRTLWHKDLAH